MKHAHKLDVLRYYERQTVLVSKHFIYIPEFIKRSDLGMAKDVIITASFE